MAILPILIAPDRRLRVRSAPVEKVDAGIRQLLDDMVETMRAAPGIGLSAIQVDVASRVIVVEASETGPDEEEPEGGRKLLHLVNPQITWFSDEQLLCEEGCLSLPDQYADIERQAEIALSFLDRDGAAQQIRARGVLARCIQHEIDHLDGHLLVDRLSVVRRDLILRKLKKAKKQNQPALA